MTSDRAAPDRARDQDQLRGRVQGQLRGRGRVQGRDGEQARSRPEAVQARLAAARQQTWPAIGYIARLSLTAIAAYLIAYWLLPNTHSPPNRPILAPLTAMLVVQATLYRTMRSSLQRVAAVTAGVLIAVVLADHVRFSWWLLGLLIAGTLALGMALRLGDNILEVPISAMLIFSYHGGAAGSHRIVDTLIGAAAGLAAGLIHSPIRVRPAQQAVTEVSKRMSALLGQMSEGLAEIPEPRRAAGWADQSRALRTDLERLDDVLETAEDSTRLNPRRLARPDPAAGLREGVDALERVSANLRILSQSVADSTLLDSETSPVRDEQARRRLASVLAELSAAVRAYGQVTATAGPGGRMPRPWTGAAALQDPARPAEQLTRHLDEAGRRSGELADALRPPPDTQLEGWPLRGEILAQVDRLRAGLRPSDVLAATGHWHPGAGPPAPILAAARRRGGQFRIRQARPLRQNRPSRQNQSRRSQIDLPLITEILRVLPRYSISWGNSCVRPSRFSS